MLFLGLAVGQLIYGPVSDSIGRKLPILVGLTIFLIGSVLSMASENFFWMLAGRFLQGLGAAGPRIVTVALIRDLYRGRAMAEIMSFIMMVFILVPMIAPIIGQFVMNMSNWRGIFAMFCVLCIISFIWFQWRQTETLPPAARRKFAAGPLWDGIKQTLSNRMAMGYVFAAGLIFGAFVGFLTSVQQILQVQYGLGEAFPYYFAAIALTIGISSFLNGKLVVQCGMRYLSYRAPFHPHCDRLCLSCLCHDHRHRAPFMDLHGVPHEYVFVHRRVVQQLQCACHGTAWRDCRDRVCNRQFRHNGHLSVARHHHRSSL